MYSGYNKNLLIIFIYVHSLPTEELLILNYQLIVINEQHSMLSQTKAHFCILKRRVGVAATALFTIWFDKQTFGFQKCIVACFDK